MRHFEQELDDFKQQLLIMASRAKAAVSNAVQAVVDRSDDWAEKVKGEDDAIDQLEIDLDETAIRLLSMAPLASQLRFITVAMKISQNLERVGDEATTIARRAIELNQEPQLKARINILQLAQLALEMMEDALDAFVERTPERAAAIVPRDKQVDRLNKEFHRELAHRMVAQPNTIPRCLNLMVISKSLERVADHAANIAEEVVFLCEARDIRHTTRTATEAPADSAGPDD
jgi:phosphate transport system protein